jgi:hypothetical protein
MAAYNRKAPVDALPALLPTTLQWLGGAEIIEMDKSRSSLSDAEASRMHGVNYAVPIIVNVASNHCIDLQLNTAPHLSTGLGTWFRSSMLHRGFGSIHSLSQEWLLTSTRWKYYLVNPLVIRTVATLIRLPLHLRQQVMHALNSHSNAANVDAHA